LSLFEICVQKDSIEYKDNNDNFLEKTLFGQLNLQILIL